MKIEKCHGKYDNARGEFGKTIDPQCIKCERRTPGSPDYQPWRPVPKFEGKCPERIEK